MKLLIIISFLSSTAAFAAQSKTDCPWMREELTRKNPKASLTEVVKVDPEKKIVSKEQ